MSEVVVPDLLEVRPDENGIMRLWIDGELFKYGTVDGVSVGRIARDASPSVSLLIVGMRVTVDWGYATHDGLKYAPIQRIDDD